MAQRMPLLEQKLGLLEKIAIETERMGKLLENNDLDAFAVCIEQKSGYIERVDAIDTQLQGEAQPQEAVLHARISETLQRVCAAGQRNLELAQSLRSTFAAQIREANNMRNLRSYGAPPPGIKFVDREG